MKKMIISLILSATLLISLVTAVYAESVESAVGYTPADVMEWYLADPDDGDMTGQSANVAARMVENLVYVAGLNANEEQLERLSGILEAMSGLKANEEITAEQKLGVNCVYIVQALTVLARESDRAGVYGEQLQGIIDYYNEVDATVDSPDVQAVNALYTSVKLAALVVEESCPSQEQIDQIEAGLSELDAENEDASNTFEQMIIGTRWLRKMLGAFAKLNNSNCIDTIEHEMEIREGIVADMSDPMEIVNQYLTSSMFALGLFTGDYSLE